VDFARTPGRVDASGRKIDSLVIACSLALGLFLSL
jgi:hypothetical protein